MSKRFRLLHSSSTVNCSIVFTIALVILIFFSACRSELKNYDTPEAERWDELAKYLAGMDLPLNSYFKKCVSERSYKNHKKYMDEFWDRVERETLKLITPWREGHVARVQSKSSFYPLSGADFVNLYSIYPDSNLYIMIAMEETGELPNLEKEREQEIESLLASIRRTVYHYGILNYFQTKVMSHEMCSVQKIGNAPVLLVFLARLGMKVVDVAKVGIDEKGAVVTLSGEKNSPTTMPLIQGMKYVFFAPNDPHPKELLYLRMRLDGNSIAPHTPLGMFLSRIEGVKTLMKSAVYLLHMKGFEPLRDFVIHKSVMIVQDDSGVPFGYINTGEWDIRLFGVYTPPYPIKGCIVSKQEDLIDAFGKKSEPLPFNFGYGSLLGKNRSNMIVAVRKRQK